MSYYICHKAELVPCQGSTLTNRSPTLLGVHHRRRIYTVDKAKAVASVWVE